MSFDHVIDEDRTDIHVVPCFGRPHESERHCWCRPLRQRDCPDVWVHTPEQ